MKSLLLVSMVCFLFVGESGAQNTFTVTNQGLQNYIINSSEDPTLEVMRGETYTFNINAPGHPFWIKTQAGIGTGNQYNDGVTNNGTQNGAITWTVPQNAPSTLFYNCEFHVLMTGTINVNDAVPVELVSFTGNLVGDNVRLEWRTATEQNNYGFEIERKLHRKDWQKIGFAAGHGTTTQPQSYQFEDTDFVSVANGQEIGYRLKQIDTDGAFEYSPEIYLRSAIPEKFELGQNYPNPFNPSTNISYSIARPGIVSMIIFDVRGSQIKQLVHRFHETGSYSISFDASRLSTGIYYYQLRLGAKVITTKKMLYLR